ncbi:hypothetical protein QQP08_001094 [Theobroma cacao]|nr:hypothetical protein QQP08_001094 [Theobroma cacao]
METQMEKVYVAVGNDVQDGFKTLAWTLRRWNSQAISIVLLHVAYNISKDFVYTPFGKLPVSAVSEEKLEVLRKYEQEKTDKLLSKRSKSAISGSFYVHQYKPHFCELYIICGGKLVVLKGNIDEGFMEDDQGITVAKIGEKPSLRNLLGKIFSENSSSRRQKCSCPPPSNQDSPKNQWEDNVQELDNYFQHLLSLNLDEENDHLLQTNPVEPDSQENTNSNMGCGVPKPLSRLVLHLVWI